MDQILQWNVSSCFDSRLCALESFLELENSRLEWGGKCCVEYSIEKVKKKGEGEKIMIRCITQKEKERRNLYHFFFIFFTSLHDNMIKD